MATQTGKPVVFGYTGTDGIAATGLTGNIIFESHEYAKKSDEVQIKGAAGTLVTRIFPEDQQTASIECYPTGADVAAARTAKATLLALRHKILNITACADAPELVNSYWFVIDVKVSGSNVGAHKVSLMLEQNAGITADAA